MCQTAMKYVIDTQFVASSKPRNKRLPCEKLSGFKDLCLKVLAFELSHEILTELHVLPVNAQISQHSLHTVNG